MCDVFICLCITFIKARPRGFACMHVFLVIFTNSYSVFIEMASAVNFVILILFNT